MTNIVDILEEIKELCEKKDCENCFYCMDGACFFGSTTPREWDTDELT